MAGVAAAAGSAARVAVSIADGDNAMLAALCATGAMAQETFKVGIVSFLSGQAAEMRKLEMERRLGITPEVKRYNEIKAAWGDDAKMTEANVTEEEKAAYQAVQDFQASLTDTVKEYKTNLIMDEEVLGAGTYNKVLAATKEDPAMKEKLDQLISELKSQSEAEKDGDGQN